MSALLRLPRLLKSLFPAPGSSLPDGSRIFWSFMCGLALCFCLAGEYFIESASQEKGRQMILDMRVRAESLIWALEAGARFFSKKANEPLQELLTEMTRQPGIAWIAMTDPEGIILQDSDSQLKGAQLYTPRELALLKPGSEIQGRFAPDDPGIYECWKLFRPERLARNSKRQRQRNVEAFYIFVALNASAFEDDMNEYLEKQRLLVSLFCGAGLCFLCLLFYMRNFSLSRKKLAATEALASEIIANYPGALLLVELGGQIILANKKAHDFLGISSSGANLSNLSNYDWQACLEEIREGCGILERELDLPGPDGRSRAVLLSAACLSGEDGTQALLILKDLSEIRQLRKKLALSQRLSAVGKMAAGLAHEIRNPLSSIRAYAHYLSDRLDHDPIAKNTAELLVDETSRINKSLADLLALARPQKLNLARNSLYELARKATFLLQPDADSKKISLEAKLPDGEVSEWPLTDADKLLQALLNLLINALQFTPEGGKVELGLARKEGERQGWFFSVRDNGKGIEEKALSQIFNPYFTTRDEGTGLGLSIVRQIVESHEGEISVFSAPGKGSVFGIFLPDRI